MRLALNLAAGLTSAGWTLCVNLIAIPLYLRLLGVEAYGLVGFLATLQAALQVLDLGVAATVNRETARHGARGELAAFSPTLRLLAAWSGWLGFAIAAAVAACAGWIADHWLQEAQLGREQVRDAVIWIGVLIGCRWPIGFYQAVLLGSERAARASAIGMPMVAATHFGGVAVLALARPEATWLFAWQAFVALVHVLILRHAVRRTVGGAGPAGERGAIAPFAGFATGMGLVGITGLLLSQLDKLLLSRWLPLAEFGGYALAAALVGGFAVVVAPIYNVFLPRLTREIAMGEKAAVRETYVLGTRLLASLLFPLAAVLLVFAQGVLHAWTGNPALAAQVAPVLGLLAVAAALHGVMHLPYALQVASGDTRLPLAINLMLIVLFLPTLAYLVRTWGLRGAACAWLLLHVIYFVIGSAATHRRWLPGASGEWLARGLLPAAFAAALAWVTAEALLRAFTLAPWLQVAALLSLSALATMACALAFPPIRSTVMRAVRHGRDALPRT